MGFKSFALMILGLFFSVMTAGAVVFDIDGDGKKGLPEAIDALQVVAGMKSSTEVPGDTITNTLGMTFVKINPGTFLMGSPEDEPGRSDKETLHQVTLTKGYYLQTTEVTQGQWKNVMGPFINPSLNQVCGDDCPVENVSWNDAKDFIAKLNEKENTNQYRLPTEAEWEYAARAGTTTPFAFGDCLLTSQANYNGNYPLSGCTAGVYRATIIPVASLALNDWGLYDMHGNVSELCSDWWSDSYSSSAVTDPTGPSNGSYRVTRGGGFSFFAQNLRSAYPNNTGPDDRYRFQGLRLAKDL